MKNLYDVTITFDPASYDGPVESVAVRGEFLFYESGLTGHTDQTGMVDCDKKYTPHEYRDGLDSIGGLYCEEMQKNAQGLYQGEFPPACGGVSLPLPHQPPVWRPHHGPSFFLEQHDHGRRFPKGVAKSGSCPGLRGSPARRTTL